MSTELTSGITERRLLQSIVEVARHVYGAAASSVFMLNPDTGELTFAAVSGAGEQRLVGRRFPAGTGVAGWVAASGQPIIADDVLETDTFARDAASSTGYVPNSIMAAPLIADGECVGVLEVLDRHSVASAEPSRDLDDMELLGLLASQAALGLLLLRQRAGQVHTAAHMGALLSRLSDHAARESFDPQVVTLLSVALNLLERAESATA